MATVLVTVGEGALIIIDNEETAEENDDQEELEEVAQEEETDIRLDITPTELLIYPNPAVNLINLKYKSSAVVSKVIIYNTMGQIVSSISISDNKNDQLIDVSNYSDGLYKVILLDDNNVQLQTKSFFKVR